MPYALLRMILLPITFLRCLPLIVGLALVSPSYATDADPKAIADFIQEMQQTHQFDPSTLEKWFAEVEIRDSILKAISRPAEGKPWHAYRKIFITQSRIDAGVAFAKANTELLQQAEDQYGVPPAMILGILGVETRYGKFKGSYPVIDALSTLAFAYPPRAKFFRKELVQYLILAREENWPIRSAKGSYAGAMGIPQFIPSSYRHYAVDFNNDGQRDLLNSTADAVGSVANYFVKHRWQPGQPVAYPVTLRSEITPDRKLKSTRTFADVAEAVVLPAGVQVAADTKISLREYKTVDGVEYWLTLPNFYVITRYNHSSLYALAAYQLGQAVNTQWQSSAP